MTTLQSFAVPGRQTETHEVPIAKSVRPRNGSEVDMASQLSQDMHISLPDRTKIETGALSPPAVGSPMPRQSALSSKVTSILSASYADIEIRDALETLDSRGVRNKEDTRRNLRRDVQKELIDCNGQIVQDFGEVAQQLKRVGDTLNSLRETCDQIRKHVSLARLETAPMLDEAGTLMTQKNQVEIKQSLLSAFKEHFLLTDEEQAALTSSAEPVNDRFFQVLLKAKRIYQDSQVLLGGENQRLGMEVLEQSTKYLNAGFQKLYRWIQREFKSLDLENPRITASIRRALRVLAERPTLFQNCLDTFAEARENSLIDAFYTALTGDSQQQGIQKPIEFSAHEPLRYVGDMLAWLHSTTVSEREALEGLFISEGDEIAKGIELGLESEPWSRTEGVEKFDGRRALSQLVNRSLAGVAQLLRQRVDQVVQSHDDPVLAYKVANLVGFYKNIFTKLVDESGFLENLSTIQDTAVERFRTTMRYQVTSIEIEPKTIPENLAPPEFLTSALESLQSLLTSYETSVAARNAQESSLELVLTEALDPFLDSVSQLADTLADPSNTVFSINCILETRTSLSQYTFTAPKAAVLATDLTQHTVSLAQSQHAFLIRNSGIDPLLKAAEALSLQSADDMRRLRDLPAFAQAPLTACARRLDDFLPSALMDTSERLKSLRNKSIALDVTGEAADRFCRDFERLEDMIVASDEVVASERPRNADGVDKDGETEDDEWTRLREIFPRTGEEIRILLS